MAISLVVVEDHGLVAAVLSRALDAVAGLSVSGVAGSVEGALAILGRKRPDVALVDLRLGERSALDHLAELQAASPATALLVVTAWPSAPAVERALAAGARGLIGKAQPLGDLVAAIEHVHAGQLAVEPSLMGELVHRATHPGPEAPGTREIEVLGLLAEARSTTEMARTLHLSEDAVRNRIKGCLATLGAHSRAEAVREATRRGWLLPAEPVLAGWGGDPWTP